MTKTFFVQSHRNQRIGTEFCRQTLLTLKDTKIATPLVHVCFIMGARKLFLRLDKEAKSYQAPVDKRHSLELPYILRNART